MKKLIHRIAFLTSCLIVSNATFAAELDDPAAVAGYLEQEIAAREIPGAVALVVDADGIVFESAHGLRDVAGGVAMTTDTIFRLASMTKPIAATAIMMLVEEGKLSLDDAIADYLPEYADARVIDEFHRDDASFTTRPAASAITIRQLLSHSSGLAYAFGSDIVTALNASGVNGIDVPLLYDPGGGWSYAHGISVVGRVLEEIEGVGLDQFLAVRLFEPLGMHDTFYVVPDNKANRVTTTHRSDATGQLIETPNPASITSAVSGDGGLHATASDYARFIQLILNDGVTPDGDRLLASESIAELKRSQLGDVRVALMDEPAPNLSRAFPLGAGRDGFGLGFQITGEHDNPGMRAPGSMSWAGIFNTEFWIDPENGIGGILLLQYLPFYDPDAIELLQGFEARVYSGLR
jgi:methyl acetate hydrolase